MGNSDYDLCDLNHDFYGSHRASDLKRLICRSGASSFLAEIIFPPQM
jgi:hypothetical protein